MDLYSCQTKFIHPGERMLIGTGIAMEIPEGYVLNIWDKSGHALKYGITILGGVVDSSYRGEIGVMILNTGDEVFKVNRGDKMAQGILYKHEQPILEETNELSKSDRGEKGYGSTGRQ